MRYLLVCLFAFIPPAFAEFYTWTDEDGVVHYSDQRPSHTIGTELTPEADARSDKEKALAATKAKRLIETQRRQWQQQVDRAQRHRQAMQADPAGQGTSSACESARDDLAYYRDWQRRGYTAREKARIDAGLERARQRIKASC